MLAWPWDLRRAGVLGINARNAHYVADGNPRHRMPAVNDKVQTKRIAAEVDVPVPDLYGVIEIQAQAKRLQEMVGDRETFVIKPATGAQGDGILVIKERTKKGWRLANGTIMSDRAIQHHVSNVLSGMYSLNGIEDRAMLEETVEFATVFQGLAEAGVPDLRVIVFRGTPALAMARIPTRESDGKANLHKGGIGLGIDMSTGKTTFGVHHDEVIEEHPETGQELAGIEMPDWRDILSMAARCYAPSGLDYLGVDIVFDKRKGPLLLELNARPGLAVQLANRIGLDARLRKIADEVPAGAGPVAKVNFALEAFVEEDRHAA